MTPVRSFLLLSAAFSFLAAAVPAKAAYLDAGAFFHALAGIPGAALVSAPSQSVVTTDAFGSSAPATAAAGQISGFFECRSDTFPCLGAYRATYTLPYEIIGLAGNLRYAFGTAMARADAIPFFGFDRDYFSTATGINGNPFSYEGFWATTFASTDTITIDWPAGLLSTDDASSFRLSDAFVVAGPGVAIVPEPTSMVLFGSALIGLAAARRRKVAVGRLAR